MKTVVITGGGDGLGLAIAQNLAVDNRVVVLDVAQNKWVGEFYQCDVTDAAAVKHMAEQIGACDVLINNAGVWAAGALDQADPAAIRRVVEVNLLGTINSAQAFIPSLKFTRGQIINVASSDAYEHKADRAVYHASKWGVRGFSLSLDDELRPLGVRVTALSPAGMQTDLFDKNNAPRDTSKYMNPAEVAKTVRYLLELPPTVVIPELRIETAVV